jgi:hypothetical protein
MFDLYFTVITLLFQIICARGASEGFGGGRPPSAYQDTEHITTECHFKKLNPTARIRNAPASQNNRTRPVTYLGVFIVDDANDESTTNYLTSTGVTNSSSLFNSHDVYYNGSFSVIITPPGTNNSLRCPKLIATEIPDAFFRLRPQIDEDNTRHPHDNNSDYFGFGQTVSGEDCMTSTNETSVSFESFNHNLKHG